MRDEFIDELSKLAEDDPSIMLVTGDLGFGVLTDFANKFPDQFINAGVAEQNMTALACGLSLEGHKVYTYSIGNFSTLRCLEQIRNDVCYHECNVTIVSVGGGFSYGQLGVSHFATEDLAILRSIPNLAVIAPSDKWETRILVKPRFVRRGDDFTFISIGSILSEVLLAVNYLEKEGITSDVITLNALKPMDFKPVLQSISKSKRVICIEEHTKIGGLSGAVAEACVTSGLTGFAFHAIGLDDAFPTIVGDQIYLREIYKMDFPNILKAAKDMLSKST